ncbi:MAG: serine/threonine protein kinase [Pseudomonadales bacterium]|nr:serine/threonine protein kinase [Pseudomonadales bacterium]
MTNHKTDDKTQIIPAGSISDDRTDISPSESAPSALSSRFIGIGSEINQRFTLNALLGRGGMGDVYLATDKRKLEAQDSDSDVAIKLLGENFKQHPQAFIALQREARKTQQLAHPNIVTVYDFDRQDDTVYLTMEALHGSPLDERINTAAIDRDEAIDWIKQCARGLAYAHQKNVVHSDLKPANVFITDEGIIKLLDFGIARACNAGKNAEKNPHKTQHDSVFDAKELGALTPAYASLEMINGEEPHTSDDVYALGIIAYELLTGKHPFDHLQADKAMQASQKAEKIDAINSFQWEAIEQALAFKREDRLDDALIFLKAFDAKNPWPRRITAAVVVFAFVILATFSYWYNATEHPDRPFEELPIAQQISFNKQLQEADVALQFNDYNSAIQHLDKAFLIHPHNAKVKKSINKVLDALFIELDDTSKFDSQSRQKQINSLRQYRSLKKQARLQP